MYLFSGRRLYFKTQPHPCINTPSSAESRPERYPWRPTGSANRYDESDCYSAALCNRKRNRINHHAVSFASTPAESCP